MSADILRRAAAKLREHAEAATPGPWQHVDHADPPGQPLTSRGEQSTFRGCGSIITWGEGVEGGDIAAPNGDLYPRSGYSPRGDMAYVALLHPPVALAWADLLEFIAETPRRDLDDEVYRRAIRAARAILREPAEGERP